MTRNTPLAREKLEHIAKDLSEDGEDVYARRVRRVVARYLHTAKAKVINRTHSTPVTIENYPKIVEMLKTMGKADIARKTGVAPGRILDVNLGIIFIDEDGDLCGTRADKTTYKKRAMK